jgi:hypothetical protein
MNHARFHLPPSCTAIDACVVSEVTFVAMFCSGDFLAVEVCHRDVIAVHSKPNGKAIYIQRSASQSSS